jgi:hypothetical protein
MSKPHSERTHRHAVERTHGSAEQQRVNKCQRSKQRNAARKAWRLAHLTTPGLGRQPKKRKDKVPQPRPSGKQLHCWPLPQ